MALLGGEFVLWEQGRRKSPQPLAVKEGLGLSWKVSTAGRVSGRDASNAWAVIPREGELLPRRRGCPPWKWDWDLPHKALPWDPAPGWLFPRS